MSDEIPPQFSPDGRYWWDGEQWIAVDQLPRPVEDHDSSPAWGTGASRGRPVMVVMIAVACVIIVAVSALVVGAATGRIRLPVPAAPTHSPTPAPTPTPTPPTPVFTGATAPDILTYLSTHQVDCNPPVADHGNQWWYCSMRGAPPYDVGFAGRDDQHILQVQAQVKDPRPAPDANQAASFLASVAGFTYAGGNPEQAQAWVRANMNGGTTVIGGATFKVGHPAANTWTLSVYPLN